MSRRITSTALPGPESVMIFTGRVGKSWARAGTAAVAARASSHDNTILNQCRCILTVSYFTSFLPVIRSRFLK